MAAVIDSCPTCWPRACGDPPYRSECKRRAATYPYFKCPKCGHTSTDPEVIRANWCPECQDFTVLQVKTLDADELTPVGRARLSLLVDGEGLVVEFFAMDDHDKLLGRFLLDGGVAKAYMRQIIDAVDSLTS